jgi:HPt (histidine-containing phosphotransfer) domain-containing protein
MGRSDMDEDLHARFVPQFVALARTRVSVALAAVAQRDHGAMPATVRELHSLAGEAGLLGLHEVIPLARDGERKAKVLHVSQADADADALVAALRALEQIIEGIAVTRGSGAPA